MPSDVDQAPPALLVCRHLAPRSICPECIRAALAGVEEPDCEDCNDTGTITDPAPDAPGARPPEPCVSCPPRTLPVTPAERACATVLRAYLAWIDTPEDVPDDGQWEASAVLEDLGDALDKREFLAHEGGPSPAGAALLARVEAVDAQPSERAAIVAFLASEENRYRRNSKDPAHDPGGRERCLHKASVLATVGRYIERGDHLTQPLDAQPRTPEIVLRAMVHAYQASAVEAEAEVFRTGGTPLAIAERRMLEAQDAAANMRSTAATYAAEGLLLPWLDLHTDYAARLAGTIPIDAPPAKEPR